MTRLLIWLLKAYRFAISPLYGQVCRYWPTCSAYALEAVETHGALRGSWLAARRVVRCVPWSPGGVDKVPPARAAEGCGCSQEQDGSTSSPQAPTLVPPARQTRPRHASLVRQQGA